MAVDGQTKLPTSCSMNWHLLVGDFTLHFDCFCKAAVVEENVILS